MAGPTSSPSESMNILDRIIDLFLRGQTESVDAPTGAAGEVAQQDFGGSYGYVMED